MMVSAAMAAVPSSGSPASPSIAKAADQNPAQGSTTATDNAAQPASTAAQAANAAPQTTPQAPVAGDAAVDPRAAQAADTASRFSDMLRAANDDDAAETPAADPKTGSADASKDDGHADAAAADTALALAQWPGMAVPVTVVPAGLTMPAPSPAANGAAGGQAATDTDAAPVTALQTGRAAALPTDPTGAAAATVAAATGASTKPSADASAGVDADAAIDTATAAPSRRTAGFHNLADDVSTASDAARTSARPETAAAGTRERVAATTSLPGTNANANANTNISANTAPMSPGWSAPVNGNANTDAGQTVTVKLPPQSPEQWRQPLTDALGDRLQLQLGRSSEQATIRLDPPMLGSIEISIRHEAGSLQVQLSASNGEVLRQLHGIGDSLRQDLSQRQGDVSVVVSDSSRNATNADQQRGRERDAETADDGPGRALAEAESETGSARTPFSLARERE